MPERIVKQDRDDLSRHAGIGAHDNPLLDIGRERLSLRRRYRFEVLGNLHRKRGEIDILKLQGICPFICLRKRNELVREAFEPFRLVVDAFRPLALAVLDLDRIDRRLDDGKRRPQLMRRIGHEAALLLLRLLDRAYGSRAEGNDDEDEDGESDEPHCDRCHEKRMEAGKVVVGTEEEDRRLPYGRDDPIAVAACKAAGLPGSHSLLRHLDRAFIVHRGDRVHAEGDRRILGVERDDEVARVIGHFHKVVRRGAVGIREERRELAVRILEIVELGIESAYRRAPVQEIDADKDRGQDERAGKKRCCRDLAAHARTVGSAPPKRRRWSLCVLISSPASRAGSQGRAQLQSALRHRCS